MKKIIYLALLVLVVFVFSSCKLPFMKNDQEFSYMQIDITDKPLEAPQSYYETVIGLKPDYENRIIEVDYFKVAYNLPKDALDSMAIIKSSGQVGGEFFDRFEEISEWLSGLDEKDYVIPLEDTIKDGGIVIALTEGVAGSTTKVYSFSLTNNVEKFSSLQSFYTDLIGLFTNEVY